MNILNAVTLLGLVTIASCQFGNPFLYTYEFCDLPSMFPMASYPGMSGPAAMMYMPGGGTNFMGSQSSAAASQQTNLGFEQNPMSFPGSANGFPQSSMGFQGGFMGFPGSAMGFPMSSMGFQGSPMGYPMSMMGMYGSALQGQQGKKIRAGGNGRFDIWKLFL